MTPTHSPPAGVVQGTEPVIRPTQPASSSTQFPDSGFSASQHQPTSQTQTSVPTSATVLPGMGFSASQHQPTCKAQTNQPTNLSYTTSWIWLLCFTASADSKVQSHPLNSSERSEPNFSASKQQSASNFKSHRPHTDRSKASDHQHSGTNSSASKHQSASKLQTDRPLSSDVTDTGSPVLHRSRKDSF